MIRKKSIIDMPRRRKYMVDPNKPVQAVLPRLYSNGTVWPARIICVDRMNLYREAIALVRMGGMEIIVEFSLQTGFGKRTGGMGACDWIIENR